MENLVVKYFGPQLEKAVPYDGTPVRRPEESDADYDKRTVEYQPYIGQKYVFYIIYTDECKIPGRMYIKVGKLWESELDDFTTKHKFIRFESNDTPSFEL